MRCLQQIGAVLLTLSRFSDFCRVVSDSTQSVFLLFLTIFQLLTDILGLQTPAYCVAKYCAEPTVFDTSMGVWMPERTLSRVRTEGGERPGSHRQDAIGNYGGARHSLSVQQRRCNERSGM